MTVGELENQVRELREHVEQVAALIHGSEDTNRKVLTALADSGSMAARVDRLEARVHALDGEV